MALMEFVTDNMESNDAGKYPRMPSFGGVPLFVHFVCFSFDAVLNVIVLRCLLDVRI